MTEANLKDYEVLEEYKDFNVTVLINKEYNKVLVILGYRGLTIEFKLIEFIIIITTLAQAASKLDISRINMESEIANLEQELKEAVSLIKEGKNRC